MMVYAMLKKLIIASALMIFCLSANAGNYIESESSSLAKDIVTDLTEGKTPEEIRAMVGTIADALSEASLCGVEAIDALYQAGIPYGVALDAIAKACKLTGPEIAAIARSLTPGLDGYGGPGGEVSP